MRFFLPRSFPQSCVALLCGALLLSPYVLGAEGESCPLFNGKDLTGWEGDMKLWKVADNAIVGDSPGIEHNQFLVTKHEFDDFELKLEFRLKEGVGNSGIQFRSKRVENSTEVSGYQADIGENYWGCLYDESRRNKVLVKPPAEFEKSLKKGDWNTYLIRAKGDHIVLKINDVTTVDYHEKDPQIARQGVIGLQVHSGGPLKVEFRNIEIRSLKD
ncbi:3-keto-disaccharide hydrolase [Schlesneria sp.]|uniref:3-keto-disaccharide hydrolase n=1 Tax=Schlesneria sp. TaxID=2762018 RepID=UPI002F22E363